MIVPAAAGASKNHTVPVSASSQLSSAIAGELEGGVLLMAHC
jgi:hypothetical protein